MLPAVAAREGLIDEPYEWLVIDACSSPFITKGVTPRTEHVKLPGVEGLVHLGRGRLPVLPLHLGGSSSSGSRRGAQSQEQQQQTEAGPPPSWSSPLAAPAWRRHGWSFGGRLLCVA